MVGRQTKKKSPVREPSLHDDAEQKKKHGGNRSASPGKYKSLTIITMTS